jgi:hypothetical protein
VRPHFVTTLDYHEASADFVRGIAEPGDTTLVAEPKVNWTVLDEFGGRRRLLHSGFVDHLLREASPCRAPLRPGSTVAHLAYYLATHLGCDPIIFVGQDLAYSEGLYYPPGVPVERVWQPELGRFQTIEMKQWERIVRHRPILRVVRDVHGRETYSDDTLCTYAEQFEADFGSATARIVHAGEAGRRIAGMEVMTLAEAADRFCTRDVPRSLLPDEAAAPAPGVGERACAELAQRLDEIRQMRAIAEETVRELERLVELLDRPAEFNRALVRVDDLRARMQRFDRSFALVVEVSQAAELRRFTADRRLGDVERETAETARQRLERDRSFVSDFVDGCEFLERVLPEAIERVRARVP